MQSLAHLALTTIAQPQPMHVSDNGVGLLGFLSEAAPRAAPIAAQRTSKRRQREKYHRCREPNSERQSVPNHGWSSRLRGEARYVRTFPVPTVPALNGGTATRHKAGDLQPTPSPAVPMSRGWRQDGQARLERRAIGFCSGRRYPRRLSGTPLCRTVRGTPPRATSTMVGGLSIKPPWLVRA
jgi:hypothetical protein